METAAFDSELRRDGFDEVLTRELPAGLHVVDHSHAFDVRAMVLGGEIVLTLEGSRQAYREGDVFMMPAERSHEEQVGPAGVRYIVGRRYVK